MTANAYSFLPWLRTGISTRITADPGTADRASVAVQLRITTEAVAGGTLPPRDLGQQVQIYGPGDVIGVDPRAISRTEPRPWTTNVEPNYLAHIEFYDEDFAWRYSPAAPDGATRRLRPWLALVVLTEEEHKEGALPGRPLPFIAVANPVATLPAADQLGAFAHVHVNGALDTPVATDKVGPALGVLGRVLSRNADSACSRLMCPRRLKPGTGYHAFLVPAFETGRLAGLGHDPAGSPGALFPAWGQSYAGQPEPGTLPYYHSWYFGTGAAGDFEYLVRLLQPRDPDPRVARRDFDVHKPAGPGLPGIETPPEINGVLRLGGALKIPKRPRDAFDKWDENPYPHPFQHALAGLINLADDYPEETPAQAHARLDLADQVDPVITPPLYGRWPAVTSRLLTKRDGTPIPAPANRNWVHRLNLDPRFRIAANFGTQVVQKRQEEFMAAAWAQVGEVLAANKKIRAAQLAREVGHALQEKHLTPQAGAALRADAPPSGKALTLTAPAHSRVTAPQPGPGLAAAAAGLVEKVAVGFHVASSKVAAAPVSPAMRRITRPGSRLIRALEFPAERPPEALVGLMDAETGAVTAAAAKKKPQAVVSPEQVREVLHPGQPVPPDPVGALPQNINFRLSLPGEGHLPTPEGEDSAEAKKFKEALRQIYTGWDEAAVGGHTVPPPRLFVPETTTSVLTGLRADETVPKRLLASVGLPDRLKTPAGKLLEVMAYPAFDLPMYQALLDMSVDTFVPNLNLIPENSITLLETDQEFIESFLVGLNHEMARELLWREYPADQRGSPFRQFWDPRTQPSLPGESAAARRERLRDIRPVHGWGPAAILGQNDNRDLPGQPEDELVLVIRGELLKKYPTAAIYAHKARWQPDDAHPDPRQERVPVDLVDPEHPSLAEIRLPIYEAKVEPDIYLLGFDLTAAVAEGTGGDAGWFFVIKERPGDPRFGLDIGPSTRVEVWNDLSWPDVDPQNKNFIRLDAETVPVPLLEFDNPIEDQEKNDQHLEDLSLPLWFSGLSSADVAYMLFQAPVLMAVHAQEMLPKWPT